MEKLQVMKPDKALLKRLHEYAIRHGKVKNWVYTKALELGISWLETEERKLNN
jgi:hypothetical protein